MLTLQLSKSYTCLAGDETWRNAVPRAISEELGTVLPPGYEISVQDDSYHTQVRHACMHVHNWVPGGRGRCWWECHSGVTHEAGLWAQHCKGLHLLHAVWATA